MTSRTSRVTRNGLRTALAAMLAAINAAPTAAAVTVNPRGVGQVLLFPYYTVNGGHDTYVSVTNTTNRGKAVKVRFREARNGRDDLSFNVYLSPYDVWTAALVSLDATGPATLITRDTSCTVPAIRTNPLLQVLPDGTRYVSFRNFNYTGSSNDDGGASLARTREGFLEVIEMGELAAGTASTQVLEEVSQVTPSGTPNSGVPMNCSLPLSDWDSTTGAWSDGSGNRQADIGRPSGGLYGTAQIINVADGTLHAYAATAIEGFYGGTAPAGALHTSPGSTAPNLASASVGAATIESLVVLDDGTPVLSHWDAGTADAVSAVLMQESFGNEFDTERSIGASTEWVVTFPTKAYYSGSGVTPALPFSDPFVGDGKACELTTPVARDRDAFRTGPPLHPCDEVCFAAPPPEPPYVIPPGDVCFAAQVIAVGQQIAGIDPLHQTPSAIFGSDASAPLQPRSGGVTSDRGVLTLGLPAVDGGGRAIHRLTSLEGDTYFGLPLIGFGATRYVNGNAQPGKLANYSGSVPLRGSVRIDRHGTTTATEAGR